MYIEQNIFQIYNKSFSREKTYGIGNVIVRFTYPKISSNRKSKI